MTGFKCCSGRKLSEQHLLNLIWEPASLAAFLFLFGAMPGAVRRGQRGSNGTWQGWWSFLIQGIRQLGPRSSWFIKMLQTMASKFKLSDWLRRRCGRSAASIKYSVTSQVLKCRNIYSVDIPQNQSEESIFPHKVTVTGLIFVVLVITFIRFTHQLHKQGGASLIKI